MINVKNWLTSSYNRNISLSCSSTEHCRVQHITKVSFVSASCDLIQKRSDYTIGEFEQKGHVKAGAKSNHDKRVDKGAITQCCLKEEVLFTERPQVSGFNMVSDLMQVSADFDLLHLLEGDTGGSGHGKGHVLMRVATADTETKTAEGER